MMSLSTFHLKGSGWYATDYSGKKAPAGEKKKEEGKSPETTEKSQPPSAAKTEE